MELTLVMFKADGSRRDFPLPKPRSVVGRIDTCDLRIQLSAVSRNHCEIHAERGTVKLRDLNSSNGTFHNGIRISRQVALNPGDRIQVGPVIFTLVIDGVPATLEPSDTMLTTGVPVAGKKPAASRKRPTDKRKHNADTEEHLATTTTDARKQKLDDLLAHVDSDVRTMSKAAGSLKQVKGRPLAGARPKGAAPEAPAEQLPVLDDDEPASADQKPADGDVALVPLADADEARLDDPIAALEAMASDDSGSSLSWLTDEDEMQERQKAAEKGKK